MVALRNRKNSIALFCFATLEANKKGAVLFSMIKL
jgi:hypothetical protein